MRVLAISRQLGAGETAIAPAVAERLGWRCIDQALLDREAAELGAPLPQVAHFDEHAPGLWESWSQPQEAERFFAGVRRAILALAAEGDAVIVGRGAGFVLKDQGAVHLRLVAAMPFRIRRVMEVRWASEAHAKELIRQSDRDRAAYFRRFFDLDWNDPLQYDLTLATSTLGVERTVEMIAAIGRAAG